MSFFDVPLGGKRIGLLHEMLPKGTLFALLLDLNFAAADAELHELETAAQAIGRQYFVAKAVNETEIESAFSTLAQSAAGALVVGAGPFFIRQRQQLIELAARLAIPAVYVQREYVIDGGLMSYGASQTDASGLSGLPGHQPDRPFEGTRRLERELCVALVADDHQRVRLAAVAARA